MSGSTDLLDVANAEIARLKSIVAEADNPLVCEENAHLRGKLDECERRYAQLNKVLKTEPMVVSQSMRRKDIAKPSISDITNLYKDDAVDLVRLLVKTYPDQFDKTVVRNVTKQTPNRFVTKLTTFVENNTAITTVGLIAALFIIVYIVEPIIFK